jgi:organic radical activating enzyme
VDELVVSEVFGPTFQGEGPSTGRRAGFLRLGRCNLACEWCDTPYTWRWSDHDPATELTTRRASDLVDQLVAMGVPLVVVTGGEPMLQQRHLPSVLEPLRERSIDVEVETAGTIAPIAEVVALVTGFDVSPKLANSGNPVERRLKPEVLSSFQSTGKAAFKFVVQSAGELDEVAAIVDECGLTNIWVMPEGTDATALLERARSLAGPVLARGWNLTSRLHVLLWGNQRGV